MANVALTSLGATASHNKTNHQGTVADNAIDGNLGTYSLMQNPAPIIWTVDLGQDRSISQYEVEWVNNSWYASAYTLQSSPDNSTWTTRHTVTSGTDAGTSGPTAIDTPATARYWRMNATAAPVEGMGPTIIALYDESLAIGLPKLTNTSVLRPPTQIKDAAIGDNVALASLGASATASSVAGGGSEQDPTNAIDANPSSYVLIPGTGWLRIDLGAPYTIVAYAVAWINSSWYASVYDIESSTDGSTWTSRHTKTGGNENPLPVTPITTPFEARYWRLKATTAPVSGMGPTYFELYTAGVPSSQSITLPLLTNTSTLRAPTVSFPAQSITMPALTNASVLRAPSVAPGAAPVTMPKLTNASVLYPPVFGVGAVGITMPKLTALSLLLAPTIVPGSVAVTLPKLTNASALRAFTVTLNGLILPKLTNVSVLRAPLIVPPVVPGANVRIWGSPVPLRFEEMFEDNDLERSTYLMPFRTASDGPGRYITLPGLGTGLHFWAEEYPIGSGSYVLPIQDTEPLVESDLPGRSVRLFGSSLLFWLREMEEDDNPERKTYLMPFGLSSGGPGRRVVLPGLGTRLAIWVEEHPDHEGTYFFPVQDGDEPVMMGLVQNDDEVLPSDK